MSVNNKLYCLVNIPVRDTVLSGPAKLPSEYQGYKNLNNPSVWPDDRLLTIGFYPYIESDAGPPAENGEYYTRSLSDFVINPTTVVRNAIYTQWPIAQVRGVKNQELENQIRVFSLNDSAFNPKVAEYIRDDGEWVSQKQGDLARLTDWADVASFNTDKPMVVVLRNSYVGASYVRQGEELTARNQAALASGQSEIWPQAQINSWVTANKAAADDPSNLTSVQKPPYGFRQGVSNPNEQFNRIDIWRVFNDDPNPANQTTYKMTMTNRQDSRDLYVFSYVNGTYLAWHKFEDLDGDNVWTLEAHSSEWVWVPNDMKFIYSYVANEAEESYYFTDEVLFPAGVQTETILVAWDPV